MFDRQASYKIIRHSELATRRISDMDNDGYEIIRPPHRWWGRAQDDVKCINLSSLFSRSFSPSLGFTLAEVLITLGIIGVVAAMTIPTLMNNINIEQHRTNLKKQYTVLTQSISLLESQNGSIDTSSPQNFIKQLATQFYMVKQGTWGDISTLPANFHYTCYKNTIGTCNNWLSSDFFYMPAFVAKDGAIYIIRYTYANCDGDAWWGKINPGDTTQKNLCAAFSVDLNGDKKPNMVGVDLHNFMLLLKNQHYHIRAFGAGQSTNCFTNYPDDYNYSLSCTNRMLQNMKMP